MCAVIPG